MRITGLYFPCPHCRAASFTRSVQLVSNLQCDVRMQCSDVECGHTFEVQTEVLRTIKPSGIPDPDVRIPCAGPVELLHA
ncbi:ogr/Delta-like zinc finger family protein [Diaphorobacter sp.]|uniref:ogr/Delta-like zinc finger family protein n=1 Tax=Diaphorobacter sp. TaxID=1934310 RepID=UPI003D1329E7